MGDSRTMIIALLALSAYAACAASAGCGGSQANTRASSAPAPSHQGELAMRAPPPRGGPTGPTLGKLEPVNTPAPSAEQRAAPPSPTPPTPPAPIRVATDKAAKPLALHGRDLVLASGLIIHRLPKGVTARTVQELGTGDEVVEIIDAHGRRLALLKQTRVAQVGVGGGPSLLQATAAAHDKGERSDWGAPSVRVVIDRFHNDTTIVTLERRADGTDWIPSGLELPGRAKLGA
jgi:hypothetical protein